MRNKLQAVAYYRTSSTTNAANKAKAREATDSLSRQERAVEGYAKAHGLEIVARFHDVGVSGADPLDARPGFADLLTRLEGNGVGMVLVEDASRFARDLLVQLVGHDRLKAMGVDLVPANAPDYFTDETPTATLIGQVLGAVSQWEKSQLVAKLRAGKARARALGKYVGGYKPVPAIVAAEARRLAADGSKSLRAIAAALAEQGHLGPSGKPYGAESVKRMLSRA